MFNIGFSEMVFIAVLALILIGPKQLPEVARTIGRFINEIKRNTDSVSAEFSRHGKDIFDGIQNNRKSIFADDDKKIAPNNDNPGVLGQTDIKSPADNSVNAATNTINNTVQVTAESSTENQDQSKKESSS